MRVALTGLMVGLLAASAAQAKVDFRVQARCIATFEVAASLLDIELDTAADRDKPRIRERIVKLDAARERTGLALATRTDLTPEDSRASQQERRAEEARLGKLPPAEVQAAADACDKLLAG